VSCSSSIETEDITWLTIYLLCAPAASRMESALLPKISWIEPLSSSKGQETTVASQLFKSESEERKACSRPGLTSLGIEYSSDRVW